MEQTSDNGLSPSAPDTATGPQLLDALLRQEVTLGEVKERLAVGLAMGVSPGEWRERLTKLETGGLLPADMIAELRAVIDAHDGSDETILKSPAADASPAAAGVGGQASGEDEPNQVSRGTAGLSGTPTDITDSTLVRRRQTPFRPATGSDWSRPAHWSGEDIGPIGPGTVIRNRYELISVIGEGGMGVVYRALDRIDVEARHKNPYVAIKILNEDFRQHSNGAIALHREARKSQALSHPNIIQVRDFDLDGSIVFMTMELLDGNPLNQLISDSKLSGIEPEEALTIIRAIGAALAHAHSKGIVHSDLKPGNVIRTREGETKVLDFGIARAVPVKIDATEDRTAFDATSLGAMTPSYASLEMRKGMAPIPSDDIYALGIIAYELLTGEHPFGRLPADRAKDKGLKPPALPWIPARQRRVLERAIAFERGSRHRDGTAFLAELDRGSPAPKIAAASVLAITTAIAAYAFYSGSQLRPDVPWESLSAADQAAFASAIEDGYTLLRFGDGAALNESLDRFSDAFAIHRNNPEALAGLEAVADQFLDLLGTASEADRRGVVRKLYCQEYLGTYAPVATACRSAFDDAQCNIANFQCP